MSNQKIGVLGFPPFSAIGFGTMQRIIDELSTNGLVKKQSVELLEILREEAHTLVGHDPFFMFSFHIENALSVVTHVTPHGPMPPTNHAAYHAKILKTKITFRITADGKLIELFKF